MSNEEHPWLFRVYRALYLDTYVYKYNQQVLYHFDIIFPCMKHCLLCSLCIWSHQPYWQPDNLLVHHGPELNRQAYQIFHAPSASWKARLTPWVVKKGEISIDATGNPARKPVSPVEGQVVYLMIYGPGFKNIQLVVGQQGFLNQQYLSIKSKVIHLWLSCT